jgi:ammonium transporter, Amt family
MRHRFLKCWLGVILALVLASSQTPAQAQTAASNSSANASTPRPADEDRIAKLEIQIADAKSAADNSWMLVSSALVLLMTGPGLALFYGGLVRKKNVLGTMMQSFAMMAIVTVLWALRTYSLAFDSGTSFIGGLHHAFPVRSRAWSPLLQRQDSFSPCPRWRSASLPASSVTLW